MYRCRYRLTLSFIDSFEVRSKEPDRMLDNRKTLVTFQDQNLTQEESKSHQLINMLIVQIF